MGPIDVILGVDRQVRTERVSPMALSQSDVPELLHAFRTDDGMDLIRDAVQLVPQELIEVEATEHLVRLRIPRHTRSTARPRSR